MSRLPRPILSPMAGRHTHKPSAAFFPTYDGKAPRDSMRETPQFGAFEVVNLSVAELSKKSYRKMTQNLWWAAGYNLLAVPLAAGALAPIGFVLPMEVGALLMSASTVVVALNAQLLRRLDLRPTKA